MDESVKRVAARIKRWRSEAGLSLQELANRSAVSPSTIHKIEHCQTVPTIAVVLKLASGLGRHATELFDDADLSSTTIHIRPEDRAEHVTSRGVRVQALGAEPAVRDIAVWRVVHPPGFSFEDQTLRHVGGELLLYIERGRLHATVGDEEFDLNPGDTLHWKASSQYAWRNESDEDAIALILGNTADAVRPALVAQLRRHESGSEEPARSGAGSPPPLSGEPLAARA